MHMVCDKHRQSYVSVFQTDDCPPLVFPNGDLCGLRRALLVKFTVLYPV